jgi:hypothetical protein
MCICIADIWDIRRCGTSQGVSAASFGRSRTPLAAGIDARSRLVIEVGGRGRSGTSTQRDARARKLDGLERERDLGEVGRSHHRRLGVVNTGLRPLQAPGSAHFVEERRWSAATRMRKDHAQFDGRIKSTILSTDLPRRGLRHHPQAPQTTDFRGSCRTLLKHRV